MKTRTKLNKRIVKGYELFDNQFNGGIQCDFEHNGKKYYADLCLLQYDDIIECMIFAYNPDGTVDWMDLYCKRYIPLTDESLVACIEDFKENN